MDLLLVVELEPVLDRAQEAIRRGQLLGIVAADVARVRQLVERGQRGANSQLGVRPAVNELEELHRELDVADAPGPELQLTLAQPATRHFALAAHFHGANGAERFGGERSSPQMLRGGLVECRAERAVARDRSRPQQCLELPWLGPLVPVRLVGRERPHERPIASFRSQIEVDPETPAGDVHHRLAFAGRDSGVDIGPAHQHDVDVRRVVELAAPELSHADDGQPGGRGQFHGRVEHVRRHVGECARHHLEGIEADEIPGGDAKELVTLPTHEPVDG